ncbi:MAG: hypothetical protein EOP10_15175 [Proteobacteria bacterium]|nr:MAG: hypothetical protein EOP10_15175 [Pseudomonadota bacterium]
MRKIFAFWLLLLLAFLPSLYAQGDESKSEKFEGLLNKLLAPGPLVLGHENLEHKDCLKCHEVGGGVPNNKCMDCHKDISSHVDAKKHFHGLMNGKACIDCHKEHKGRNAIINAFDQKTFDHSRTGFILDGAHVRAECTSCHTEKRSEKITRKSDTQFFGKQGSTCLSCHAKDDIHFFETPKFKGKDCGTCHVTEAWKNVEKFDHTRETGYALVGIHAEQSCKKCHVSEGKNNIKYSWPRLETQKCLSCHKDQHKTNFSPRFQGPQCLSCHNQRDFKQSLFKHDQTGFPLNGAHANAQCVDCHKSGNKGRPVKDFNFKGLQKTCSSCHVDFHGYGNEVLDKLSTPAKNCQTCHSEQDWKQPLKFDHSTQTRFPITGKHKQNNCFDCHKPKGGARLKATPNTLRQYFFKGIPQKTCESCHKSVHPPEFHKRFKNVPCQACHTPEGWNIQNTQGQIMGNPTFHDKTRFPLTGTHQKISCKSCHQVKGEEVYKFPSFEKKFCIDCHTSPHKQQFAPETNEKTCATCHTTVKFDPRPTFDHDTTGFKLVGQHKDVKSCWSCHVPTKQNIPFIKVAKPAHNFKFSREKDPNLCANCHTSVHKKQFKEEFVKKSCASCHTPAGFEKISEFNHDQTDFKITGAHKKFEKTCVDCHKPSKDIVLATKPPKRGKQFIFPGEQRGYCENCHVNEHKTMFDPKFATQPCTSCHTTAAFTPRKVFDHDATSFELKAKHLKVKCAACHTPTSEKFTGGSKGPKGKYDFPEMKVKDCATCHTDPHKGANGPKCSSCHTENGWKSVNGGDFHKNMELVGVHLLTDCKSCHSAGRILRGTSQECSACHIKDDNHNGQLPRCGECHLQNFWTQTKFDHNLTRFPLQGAHRVTDCRSCHNQGVYQGLPTDCRSCHVRDAEAVATPDHKTPRRFQCERCHSTFNFGGAVDQ